AVEFACIRKFSSLKVALELPRSPFLDNQGAAQDSPRDRQKLGLLVVIATFRESTPLKARSRCFH
ncbi:MAG: hypothetical protein WB919_00615, partial [Candidatus Sulfotelmatobacter sp.]